MKAVPGFFIKSHLFWSNHLESELSNFSNQHFHTFNFKLPSFSFGLHAFSESTTKVTSLFSYSSFGWSWTFFFATNVLQPYRKVTVIVCWMSQSCHGISSHTNKRAEKGNNHSYQSTAPQLPEDNTWRFKVQSHSLHFCTTCICSHSHLFKLILYISCFDATCGR